MFDLSSGFKTLNKKSRAYNKRLSNILTNGRYSDVMFAYNSVERTV